LSPELKSFGRGRRIPFQISRQNFPEVQGLR
jgi:hypothetical protein